MPQGKRVQDLPDESWALVFARLKGKADRDAAALTCRRWRSLEALSRHSLCFLDHNKLSEDQGPRLHLFLLQALHSFPNIFSITVQGYFSDLHHSFPRVFLHKGFAQLSSLDLSISSPQLNDHLVQCLAVNCPSLIHLSFGNSEISDAGMYSLAHGCRLLRSLDMSICSITDKGIDGLLSKCADMQQFMVEKCDIKGWGFRHGKCLEKINARECYISSAGLAEGLRGATCLRELNLSRVPCKPSLRPIWECCKGLEVLDLTGASSLNDISLKKIVESCENLLVLNVSWCDNVTVDGWIELALSGRKLEKLAVAGCIQFWPECLLDIAEGCPNLRLLEVLHHFADEASLERFRISRPTVEVRFYDEARFLSSIRPI